MTREERKRRKELGRYLEARAKEEFKKYHLKKKDFVFYISRDGMFYSVSLFMNQDDISVSFCAKPFWVDDILWDILEMGSNREEPVSLRGVGAFTVRAKVRERKYGVEGLDFEGIDGIVGSAFGELVEMAGSYGERDFLDECGGIEYQREVIEVIVLIHNKEYEKVVEMCRSKRIGYFGDVGKGFSELAVEYLQKMGGFGVMYEK